MLIAEPGTVCADTSTAQVQLYPNSLFANFNIVNGNCEENSLQIQIQDASVDTLSNIINWQWVITQGTTTYESNDTNPSFTLFTPGSASLSLIVTAANGCRDTLVQPFPVIFFNDEIFEDSAIYCIGNGNVPLNPNLDFAGASFQWLPPTGLSNPNSINPLANPGMTTTYQAVISDATGFCQTERTVTVLVSPDASVTPSIDTVVLGESVQILASLDPSYTYAWSPPTWLNDPSIHNPVSTPNNDISYLLTVTDEFGCFVELDVVLLVTTLCEEPFVFIPTGFSPNGDNKNDQFKVYGNDLELVRLVVYNRWGEKVFESTDPDLGWDGYYKGKLLPPDVYGFYAEVTCGNGGLFFKKGNVTLLR
jgi:gliding motility-associated-like protein